LIGSLKEGVTNALANRVQEAHSARLLCS